MYVCMGACAAGNMPSFRSELVRVQPASAAEEDAAMEMEAEVEAEAAGGDSGALVRLLCVPSFAATGQVVLVDISSADLPCHVLHFK